MREHARAVVDAACELGECDFATEVAEPFPIAVICDLMGVPEKDRSEIARLSRVSVPLGDAEFGTFEDALQAAFDLIEYAKVLQVERRRYPADDLTTALMSAEVDGEHLSEAEVGSYFELLVTAGIETTGTAIAHGALALSRDPEQWHRWRADFASLAPAAVEEILRWSTPVMHFRRTAAADVELSGEQIRAGDKVVLFYHSANRDESVFDDPYRFDISRDPNPHLSFGGGGRHMCLGAHLARLELRVIFEELSRRLPDLDVFGDPVLAHSMFTNGVKSLPCVLPAGGARQRVPPFDQRAEASRSGLPTASAASSGQRNLNGIEPLAGCVRPDLEQLALSTAPEHDFVRGWIAAVEESHGVGELADSLDGDDDASPARSESSGGGMMPVPVSRNAPDRQGACATEPAREILKRADDRGRVRRRLKDGRPRTADLELDVESSMSTRRSREARPERTGSVVDLGLRQVEGIGTFDASRRDVVADRERHDVAFRGEHEHEFGFGHIPGRVRAD